MTYRAIVPNRRGSLALGMGVSQLAKLEYLLRCGLEGRARTSPLVLLLRRRRSVIREVASYHDAIEQTTFDVLTSPTKQETLGIHKIVAKLLLRTSRHPRLKCSRT